MIRDLLLAALAVGPLLAPLPVAAQLEAPVFARPGTEFLCLFSRSSAECGFHLQARTPGRATLVHMPERGYAVRLRTEPGDTNIYGSERAERADLALTPEATDCSQGREAWWAHSVLFPDDYVAPPAGGWGVVFDFHHTGSRGQANFHVDAAPEGLRLRGYGGRVVDGGHYEAVLGPIRRNAWYDFVYHVRWSSGPDGWFRAWVNGVKRLDHRGPTLYAGMGCYLKLANYHSAFGRGSSVIHARVLRGGTPEAVALTPLQGISLDRVGER